MKINLKKFFILFIGAIIFSCNIYAQRGGETQYASPLDPSRKPTPIYFGPAFGFNIMGHSMTIPTFQEDLDCPYFKNATGLGIFAGLTLERLFGEVATSSSSIIFRILYNMYPGSVSITDVELLKFNEYTNSNVATNVDHTIDVDYNALTFEAMYKINPVPGTGLGIVVGPAIDYIITKNSTRKTNIIYPNNAQFVPEGFADNVTFENNRQTVVWESGEIPEASTIRFGIKAGVQYEILLGSKLYIAPSVSYNFGLTTLQSRYTWRVSPLQVGIDARFAF